MSDRKSEGRHEGDDGQPPEGADGGRRNATKVLAGMAALGLGLGVTRSASAGGPVATYFANGKEIAEAPLPEDVARALLDGAEVEGETVIGRTIWRFNFKVEIEG